jgi:hypothetical protein
MRGTFTVRAGGRGDMPRLEALLAEMFSPAVARRARWKYLESPALAAPLLALAEAADGRLVGCYPFIGRDFVIGGRRRLAALAADIAVRPEYRTGGEVYGSLAVLAGELAREAGVAFAYGFPNRAAHRVARRLLAVADWAALEAWTLRLRSAASALIRRAMAWSPRAGATGARVAFPATPGEAAVEGAGVRDAAFLEWRFGDASRYRVRTDPGAYLVVARAGRLDRDALVVDFAPPEAEAELETLLRAEVASGRARGTERLWVWCLPGSAMARTAARCGFQRAPERDKPATVDGLGQPLPPPPAHLTIADADDP